MSLQARIEALEKELQILSKDVAEDEQARQKLLGVNQQATAMLETPPDIIWKLLFQVILLSDTEENMERKLILRYDPVMLDLGDSFSLVRILRPLAATHVVIETGYEAYVAGPVSKAFTISALLGGFKFMHDEGALCCTKMPEFLAQTGYKNPEGPMGVFQYAENTELPFFPWLMQYPAKLTGFLTMLEGWRLGRTQWFEIFPTEELLFEGFEAETENSALHVDVAGGNRYDIQTFKSRFPNQPGRLVLQDLPSVINDIKELHPDIVRQKYDFFTEQPIKGARTYYFRSICHEWSDEKCREILGNTVAAMEPGYSKILINDWVLPDSGSPLLPALLDIQMLAVFSGMERTQPQWKKLLGSVGLEIVKFHTLGKGTEGLIEAVRKL
ncbi:MAG: hypothetical protein ALECFALPRED_008912 [Alectoria fallacina]|uniref:O-methyltransferase C-terminal domain-containing protein n=1 Tax=Alectoria fallacina TaxID=1903189 RepID=A0A8H3IAJ6_9LECA|nr:MAG: hypothetical protein ALECFALPRED_008912 [Alectoria fallacina]